MKNTLRIHNFAHRAVFALKVISICHTLRIHKFVNFIHRAVFALQVAAICLFAVFCITLTCIAICDGEAVTREEFNALVNGQSQD